MDENEIYLVAPEIDAPIPIFAWEAPEIVIVLMVFGICLVVRQFVAGIVLALLILSLAKKLRAGRKRGQMQHLLWRLGLQLDTPLKKHGPRALLLEYMR